MRRVLLDTNVLIDFLRDPEAFAVPLGGYDRLVLPPPVVAEFLAGASESRQGRENRLALEEFLRNPAVEECPITSETAAAYARIFRALKDAGTPIPANDIWIAAAAIQCGAPLLTRDAHFRRIPSLLLA